MTYQMAHHRQLQSLELPYLSIHEELPLCCLTVQLEIVKESRTSLSLGKTREMVCQGQGNSQLLKQGFQYRNHEGIVLLVVSCEQ